MPFRAIINFFTRLEAKIVARREKREQANAIRQAHNLRLNQYHEQTRSVKGDEAEMFVQSQDAGEVSRDDAHCALGYRASECPGQEEDALSQTSSKNQARKDRKQRRLKNSASWMSLWRSGRVPAAMRYHGITEEDDDPRRSGRYRTY